MNNSSIENFFGFNDNHSIYTNNLNTLSVYSKRDQPEKVAKVFECSVQDPSEYISKVDKNRVFRKKEQIFNTLTNLVFMVGVVALTVLFGNPITLGSLCFTALSFVVLEGITVYCKERKAKKEEQKFYENRSAEFDCHKENISLWLESRKEEILEEMRNLQENDDSEEYNRFSSNLIKVNKWIENLNKSIRLFSYNSLKEALKNNNTFI